MTDTDKTEPRFSKFDVERLVADATTLLQEQLADVVASEGRAVAAEREACAKVAEGFLAEWDSTRIADAIRARGTTNPEKAEPLPSSPAQTPGRGIADASPFQKAPPYPGPTCDLCGINVAPFAEPTSLELECESLKRQLEKWQTGQLTRLADGRISAESPSWREKHDALKKRVAELEAELTGTNDAADRQRERAKHAERERDAHRAEVERLRAIKHPQAKVSVVVKAAEKERDEARGAYKDVKALVTMLDNGIRRGAGCCFDEEHRGVRVSQIRRLIDDIDTGGWAKSHEERLHDAWAERDDATKQRDGLLTVLRSIATECGGQCCECHGPEWAVAAIAKFGGGGHG